MPIDKRREPRVPAEGNVRIEVEDPVREQVMGRLLDQSLSGFRAAHDHSSFQNGQVVRFEHPGASGIARVIWNRIADDRVETGFLVLA